MRVLQRGAAACLFVSAWWFGTAIAADSLMLSTAEQQAIAPEIATGTRGEVYVIWVAKDPTAPPSRDRHQSSMDVWLAASRDAGQSFAAPVRVNATAGDVWGFAVSKPRVAVAPTGTVHVFYPANAVQEPSGLPYLAALYARSTDQGRSFEPARELNTRVRADASGRIHGGYAVAHAFGTLGAAPDGAVHAYWIDTRETSPEDGLGRIYGVQSIDDGRHFEAEQRYFARDVCPCCQLTVAFDETSDVYLASRRVTGDNYRGPTVALSTDGGRSFQDRVAVSGARWQLDGCPLKATAIAVTGSTVYTAVYNGAADPAGVYFSRSTDGGRSFEDAVLVHPQAAVSDAPTIAASEDAVVLLWHAKLPGGERRIYLRRSGDRGRTFGEVAEMPAPDGTASLPAAAVDRDGTIHVAWQQGDQIRYRRLTAPSPSSGR